MKNLEDGVLSWWEVDLFLIWCFSYSSPFACLYICPEYKFPFVHWFLSATSTSHGRFQFTSMTCWLCLWSILWSTIRDTSQNQPFFLNWHLISACEPNNAMVKVDGVAGRWSVVQRWHTQLTSFEASVDALQNPEVHHHDSGQEYRKYSQNISRHSKSAIDGYGNPFLKERSDLILEHEITNRSVTEKVNGTLDAVVVLNGPAIVNMLKPGAAKTFQEYAQDVSSWGLMLFGWLQIKSIEGIN